MTKTLLYLLLPLCWALESLQSQDLILNEIMASNDTSLILKDGSSPDWIELKNNTAASLSLASYYLSDDEAEPNKWQLPNIVLGAGEYFLVYASDQENDELHANFKISATEETIYLSEDDLLESLSLKEMTTDVSLAKNSEGDWIHSRVSTPGYENQITPFYYVRFSHLTGIYPQEFNLGLSIPNSSGLEVRYTLDGSVPQANSIVYELPLRVKNPTENSLPQYPTAVDWKGPRGEVERGMVVRARAFENGKACSDVYTNTFFIHDDKEERFSLPIMFLTLDSAQLMSNDSGMYVLGGSPGSAPNTWGANFWKKYEYEGHAAYLNEEFELGFQQNIGISLHGGMSRKYALKSFRLNARKEYGKSEMKYPVFKDKEIDKFKRLILRNSGQDIGRSYFRDALMQELVKDKSFDTQHYQPASVFVNGEYWGIMNLRDRYDRHYLHEHYQVDKSSVDLLEGNAQVNEGNNDDFLSLIDFVKSNDLSQNEHYAYVESKVDLRNFIEYQAAEIYFNNKDWPHVNIRFWRSTDPVHSDGKWRWLMYDLDPGFGGWAGGAATNSLLHATDSSGNGHGEWATVLLRKLLSNKSFKDQFILELCNQVNYNFNKERVIHLIDSLEGNLKQEMPYHIDRWQIIDSEAAWNYGVNPLRTFAEQRPAYVQEHMKEFFPELGELSTMEVVSEEGGKVKMGDLSISSSPFQGEYFAGMSIVLVAQPESGYQFAAWSNGMVSDTLQLTLEGDTSVAAIFEPLRGESNLYINEVLAKNSDDITDFDGEQSDWIEIYNDNSYACGMSGFYLSDDADDLEKWDFPSEMTIAANGFLLLFANDNEESNPQHLNFKISSSGETIYLSQKVGSTTRLVDELSVNEAKVDVSWGRIPDGGDELEEMYETTPGSSNKSTVPEEPQMAQIFINEYQAKGNSTFPDEEGEYEDWIEIYNPNDFEVDLAGYYLTDDLSQPTKHQIPYFQSESTTISPRGYLVFFADNDPEQGARHLNFKLNALYEAIGISYKDQGKVKMLDYLEYLGGTMIVAAKRMPDGYGSWYQTAELTPGKTNQIISGISDPLNPDLSFVRHRGETLFRFTDQDQLYDIVVYNSLGQLVSNTQNVRAQYQLPREKLQGMYVVQVRRTNSGRVIWNGKFVFEK